MLQNMESPVQSHPSADSSSFAGLLASLTSRNQPRKQPWDDGDMGDDVASFTYESALRAQARYGVDFDTTESTPLELAPNDAQFPHPSAFGQIATSHATRPIQKNDTPEGDLRRASVTVRMSNAELDRLRRRAGEAGLTISAYLRSCTFEVESLRAEVKEALAQLKWAEEKSTTHRSNREDKRTGDSQHRIRHLWSLIWRFRAGKFLNGRA